MTTTLETALLIAVLGIVGIFAFMAIFYFLIKGLDKWLPYKEEEETED